MIAPPQFDLASGFYIDPVLTSASVRSTPRQTKYIYNESSPRSCGFLLHDAHIICSELIKVSLTTLPQIGDKDSAISLTDF